MEQSSAENHLDNRDPKNQKKRSKKHLKLKSVMNILGKTNKSAKKPIKPILGIDADSGSTEKIENLSRLHSARNSNSGLEPSNCSLYTSTPSLATSTCLTNNELSNQCADESKSDLKCVNVESNTIDDKVNEWLKKRERGCEYQNEAVVEKMEFGDVDLEKSTLNHPDELVSTDPSDIILSFDLDDRKEKTNLEFKILVVGELKSGKTSIINQYVHKCFSGNYQPVTIGIDYSMKIITWDERTIIKLHFWDTAGQEQFMDLFKRFYKNSHGAFIVFDVTNTESFEAVPKWKKTIDSNVELTGTHKKRIPCVMLANKCDEEKNIIIGDFSKMDAFCKQHELSGWLQTSAKNNVNIDQSVQVLISKIIQNEFGNNEELEEEETVKDVVDLAANSDKSKMENKNKNCFC